ncbi:MAG: TIGR03915 family putative DNA repair protein [Pseudomonadota bacterium]
MKIIQLSSETDFEGWRQVAKLLWYHHISPQNVMWRGPSTAQGLFDQAEDIRWRGKITSRASLTVPRQFIALAKRAICHQDENRFDKLYQLFWRLQKSPRLLENASDRDVSWLLACDKAIRRDVHKMHAFVRFRKVGEDQAGREQFAAWFEPTHYIVGLATPFFRRRFPNMDWVIVTPYQTAIWNGEDLTFGPGGQKSDIPKNDAIEDQWRTYFSSIFNPARLKVKAMTSEMPKKYWHNLPEADLIPSLIATAQDRELKMQTDAVTTPHPLAAHLKAKQKAVS